MGLTALPYYAILASNQWRKDMDAVAQLKRFQRLTAKVAGDELRLRNLVKAGNLKIPKTTAIFNMCSATDCPSKRLGLCAAQKAGVKCYAKKSEVASRPEVLPYRRKQEKYWRSITSDKFALDFLSFNAMKPESFSALRFNEAGDFHGQGCVIKAESVARILRDFGVVCYCYTSRSDLDFSRVRNLIINGSGFTKEGITSEFKIVVDKDVPEGYKLCPMDCNGCKRCQRRGMKTAVPKH
jgi:hypothetical protein